MKFCSECAAPVSLRIPVGDDRERYICSFCGTIFYTNPKVIVGCLPTVGEKILLCKRAIEPRYGKWTLPAGFMENGETSLAGAARETLEEANAKAINLKLYRVFDVPHISQVYLFYLCTIENDTFGAGPESLETALFPQEEIPWDNLAFPVVAQTLKEFLADRKGGHFTVRNSVVRVQRPVVNKG